MWTYEAEVVRVVDGDTLDLSVDLGFNVRHRSAFRLLDCWAPELYSGAHRAAGTDAGQEVLRWLGLTEEHARWWQAVEPAPRKRGWHIDARHRPRVIVRSTDGLALGTGKYGRWLVEVMQEREHGPSHLNRYLVSTGHAWRTREEMVEALARVTAGPS